MDSEIIPVKWFLNILAGMLVILTGTTSSYAADMVTRAKCADASFGPDQAIQHCTVIIDDPSEQNQDQFVAHLNRARAYFAKRQWDHSLSDYDAAARLFPDIAATYNERGTARDRKGDVAQAISDFSTAIRLEPDNARAYGNRGLAHFRNAALDLALADFNEAIRLDPTYSVAYNGRGVIRATSGVYREAIADFSEAIKLNAFYANAYYNRGKAYAANGEFGLAVADIKMAVQIEQDPKFYNELAWTYFRSGQAATGLPFVDSALRLNPRYAAALDTRALIYESLGDNEKAIADLKAALVLDPGLVGTTASLRRLMQNTPGSVTITDVVRLVQTQGWSVNLGDMCDKMSLPEKGANCIFQQISVEETVGRGDPRGFNVRTPSDAAPKHILIFHLKPLAGEFFLVSPEGNLLKAFVRFKGSDYSLVPNEEVREEFNADIEYWKKNFTRLKLGLEAEKTKSK